MPDLLIDRIEASHAEQFWNNSSKASIFTKPSFLSLISSSVQWWGGFVNGNLIATWPVCTNEQGHLYTPEFSYYVGPLINDRYLNQPEHKKSSSIIKIYAAFTRTFEIFYQNIQTCLSTDLIDVRFFLWENFKEKKYEISPRFTAYIDNLDILSKNDILANFRSVRRQNLKYSLKAGFTTSICNRASNINQVLTLYKKTFERQGKTLNSSSLMQIKNILLNTPEENMICVHAHHPNSHELAFFGLILHANRTANLVLNCTSDNARKTGVSSLGIYTAIIAAKDTDCNLFDFNGANSPNRADDKHSYGAKPVPYFFIEGTKQ